MAAAVASVATAQRLRRAGADVLVAYHSSVSRDAGLPSVAGLLPWVNANDQTAEILPDVVAGAAGVPVFATVCGNDRTRDLTTLLRRVATAGASGVMNAPTMGLFSGAVRDELERHGLGYTAEVALVRAAAERGLLSLAYVFDPTQARQMVDAGASALVVHLGITSPTPVVDLGAAAALVTEVAATCASVPLLVHGGPLADAGVLQHLRHRLPGAASRVGFFGATALRAVSGRADLDAWRAPLSGSEHPRPATPRKVTP